ncbi:conserved hypothetical protein [Xenorhabdus nematophila F1]|uniref:Uncharacterized protein n=1 Tax=Xenorhabdus nematophila (strain ATCC 19061 / DSM 3370 / CCUG 14189 / LMG 1036 / NCIMB 9965 / AN6) TaxID=406817 RepID=D3VL78_XENNA|nr:hypothetical protein XNC1_0966 [Xenorhabdus nematophila ATCC 19061]CCW32298.1 conserved hypothetical protein [Xenorhabdus nematophila F1]CEE91375.1 hypothetical protein XNA1_2070004 [Xenorhabdus nematophila str. Anatoliense]CEE93447.1 hypothetical protein XNA1_380004 [Xenorhabdus nematophila str. Anatoliense]CEF31209.1 hypothetical protein XNW1_3200003 [Xenorhabdus nematophila str. Websteri]
MIYQCYWISFSIILSACFCVLVVSNDHENSYLTEKFEDNLIFGECKSVFC